MSSDSLAKDRIRLRALELGFAKVGVTEASDADSFAAFEQWLANGYQADMGYLVRGREARRHPRSMLEPVRSVWMLAWDCSDFAQDLAIPAGHGRVARYAWGRDYHLVLREKLSQLGQFCREHWPRMRTRGVVDTAPLLERDFARRAGLGWLGKNCMLIDRDRGSHLMLAGFLTSDAFASDPPFAANHCGTCTACLQACPTGALLGPGLLDARLCISYLTIEARGKLAAGDETRREMGNWLFGCDICQDVCPWNSRAAKIGQDRFRPTPPADDAIISLDPFWVLGATLEEMHALLGGRALERTGENGLRRNALIVIGNQFARTDAPSGEAAAAEVARAQRSEDLAKIRCWLNHPDEGIADAARWAFENGNSKTGNYG